MLTAYDYSTAKLIDEAGVNGILVGDPWAWLCLVMKIHYLLLWKI